MDIEKQGQLQEKNHFRYIYPSHWEPPVTYTLGLFRHPTSATFYDPDAQVHLQWYSRCHRKGRLSRAVNGNGHEHERSFPRLFGLDFEDISWHVSAYYLLGSLIFCAIRILGLAFFVAYTEAAAKLRAALAFIGCVLYFSGTYLSFVETLNPGRELEYRQGLVEEAHKLEQEAKEIGRMCGSSQTSLRQVRKHFGKYQVSAKLGGNGSDSGMSDDTPKWRWWGTDWHSVGWVASIIQLFGCVMSVVSALCSLPGILPADGATITSKLSARSIILWEVFCWAPYLISSTSFIIGGALCMLECQRKWYKPELSSLGWHISFLSFLGAWGFWLRAAFGAAQEAGACEGVPEYATTFLVWWGCTAFLLASYLQLFETLNK